jgi:GntR family transcriptional regulator/MocR family aminotransferase
MMHQHAPRIRRCQRVSPWEPTLFLEPGSSEPIFRQIARGISEEIRRGRFRPGDPLPGYRTIARQLGVSRNTVIAAYRELQEQGFVVTRPVVGSVVAPRPPAAAPDPPGPAKRSASRLGFDLADGTGPLSQAHRAGLLEVGTGVPDPRLVPGAALGRAYRRAVTAHAGAVLAPGDPRGHPRLRQALAAMLAGTRGLTATADEIFVTRGSQMALYLLAEAISPRGGGIAVEELGDRRAWEAFARAGARCHPVPVDEGGLDVEALDRLAAASGGTLRAVLVTPHRQYPTLVAMAPERRARLLAVAAARRLAVLELDHDSEFHFEGAPARSLASQDPAGVVVHVGTLSKLFAASLRLGFIVAPLSLVARLKGLRAAVDRHGDPALELAMAELMEDGELERHLNRMVLAYRSRRDALCAALAAHLGAALEVVPPAGGLALWALLREPVDLDAWAARAMEAGVAFRPGRVFAFEGRAVPALRMGFAAHAERELEEAVRRMAAARPRPMGPPP